MDGRVGEALGRTEIGTLDGAVPPGEVLADIGAESRMAPHRHLAVEDEVEVLDGEESGSGTVTMTIGGYHRLEGIAILRLPGVDAEAVAGTVETVGTVGAVGEGRGTRDLVVHPAETPGMIERIIDPDGHTGRGGIIWSFT